MEFINYYKILGVNHTATLQDIKTAYRKLSKKFHPDVNNGDKFFAEKFIEVQEAYEVLSNEIRRRDYDYRFKSQPNNSETNADEYREYVRKKETEFENRAESFKEWEESLKNRERVFQSKSSNKFSKIKFKYLFGGFGMTGLLIILVYLFGQVRAKNVVTENAPDSTATVFPEKPIDSTNSNGQNMRVSHADILGFELVVSKFSDILDGNWLGKAFQFDAKEAWDIEFNCSQKNDEFKVSYPTLGCSGIWKIKSVSNDSIEFTEHILTSGNNCYDGAIIRLKEINREKLEIYYYWPNQITLNAKGIINKQ